MNLLFDSLWTCFCAVYELTFYLFMNLLLNGFWTYFLPVYEQLKFPSLYLFSIKLIPEMHFHPKTKHILYSFLYINITANSVHPS